MKTFKDKNEALAYNLIHHSLGLKKGDNLYIDTKGEKEKPYAMLMEMMAREEGINVRRKIRTVEESDNFWMKATEQEVNRLIEEEVANFNWADGIMLFRAPSKVILPEEQQKLFNRYMQKAHIDVRVKRRWCLTWLPNDDKDIKTYIDACSIDYEKMDRSMDALVSAMSQTNEVHIIAPGTDLNLSIKGQPPVKCMGLRNMPDGEVYVGPIKDSVNGKIRYNVPGNYDGFTFEDIELEFENGKIVDARANNTEYLNRILDTDEGARYIGEFSFGLNPVLKSPLGEILYDEKIAGSIHLTPGGCYDKSYNGNESSVHFDIVQSHRPEFGGGEIYFDDVLVRKDGEFVLDSLKGLNPENLMQR